MDKELQDLLLSPCLLEDLDLESILNKGTSGTIQIQLGSEEQELLNQINDEIRLEKNITDVNSSLEKRLSKLKEFNPVSNNLKTQNKLFTGIVPKSPSISDFIDETENWCCICNEDGILICIGCDNDVYCKVCFNQGHKEDPELRSHKTKRLE